MTHHNKRKGNIIIQVEVANYRDKSDDYLEGVNDTVDAIEAVLYGISDEVSAVYADDDTDDEEEEEDDEEEEEEE